MSHISIIIPSFQHAATIGACLESLLSQTLPPKEIIVIDDGSSDKTREVVTAFSHPVRYQFQTNQGAPTARNNGAARATGDFLLFCDADIVASPVLLERLHQKLVDEPEASFSYSAFQWGSKLFRTHSFDPSLLRKRNFIHTSSLIRREAFPGFDPQLKRFQDWDLWLTMLEQGKRGVPVNENLFRVRKVKGRKNISAWLPAFIYRVPWPWFGWKPKALREYEKARDIIVAKHHLL